MSWLVTSHKLDLFDDISAWAETKVIDSIGDDLTTEVYHIFLAESLLINDLINVEKKLATIDCCHSALVVNSCDRFDCALNMILIKSERNGHCHAKQVAYDFPDSGLIKRNSHHVVTVFRERQTSDSLEVLVLDLNVIKELLLVELHHVKDFLCLFQLLSNLEIL